MFEQQLRRLFRDTAPVPITLPYENINGDPVYVESEAYHGDIDFLEKHGIQLYAERWCSDRYINIIGGGKRVTVDVVRISNGWDNVPDAIHALVLELIDANNAQTTTYR